MSRVNASGRARRVSIGVRRSIETLHLKRKTRFRSTDKRYLEDGRSVASDDEDGRKKVIGGRKVKEGRTTHSPGGVVILGSHVVNSPRQYACACGMWKGSSLRKPASKNSMSWLVFTTLGVNFVYHVRLINDRVHLLEHRNAYRSKHRIKRGHVPSEKLKAG